MARIIRLLIEDDPTEIEIRIESADATEANRIAEDLIVPIIGHNREIDIRAAENYEREAGIAPRIP